MKFCEMKTHDGKKCGSRAFNLAKEGISQTFCDACHWRFLYDELSYRLQQLAKKYT